MVVLDDVLLHNGISSRLEFALSHSVGVEVSLRDEAVVSGQMISRLCGSDVQFVMFNVQFGGVFV